MSAQVFPLSDFFDLPVMQSVLAARISDTITIHQIGEAFTETRPTPEQANTAISKIVFEPHAPCLDKVFLLKDFLNNSPEASNPIARNKAIRNLGYLLFAKSAWFENNLELAKLLFPNQKFDELFFRKRIEHVCQFRKKNAPVVIQLPST